MRFETKAEVLLVDFLREKIGGSISNIKQTIRYAQITVNSNEVTQPNPLIPAGSVVVVDKKKKTAALGLEILFEDSHLLAVIKPCGLLSSGQSNKESALTRANAYLKQKSRNKEQAYIVHRLDQSVSGVLLFAKSEMTSRALHKNWQEHEKIYHALVEGCPIKEEDTLTSWLRENSQFVVYSGSKHPDAKIAITHYKINKKFRSCSLLEVKLATGRKNQIRVQLAEIGHPIVGDTKYGARTNSIRRLGLHAHTLKFKHPITEEEITLSSPTPISFFNR